MSLPAFGSPLVLEGTMDFDALNVVMLERAVVARVVAEARHAADLLDVAAWLLAEARWYADTYFDWLQDESGHASRQVPWAA